MQPGYGGKKKDYGARRKKKKREKKKGYGARLGFLARRIGYAWVFVRPDDN